MNESNKVIEVDAKKLKLRLTLSILTGVLFFSGLIFAYNHISEDSSDEEAPVAVRTFFRLNESIASAPQKAIPLCVQKPRPAKGKPPRVNGDEGLKSPIDLNSYVIEVISGVQQLHLTPDQIKQHPAVDISTEFKCIEGWSQPIHYKGLKFSDFMALYNVGKKSDGSYYKYVGLETPDEEYYVSIDMKSMLHPQTVLAYEMNEAPLSLKNGAPLRLIIPIKYGVKSLKRIGRIFFADERPKDFWTEQGYDWYSGL
ncbi:MAG: molybdopterin-dependent oxidoreductase [Bdellovibrio sp.]|nr:molybdopterin-dependent oxidoreductase [Bdellovibrio sp.]